MNVLNDTQIRQKVKRLAFEIIEQNLNEKELWLMGINNNGTRFATLLRAELEKVEGHSIKIGQGQIKLNPASPMEFSIELDVEKKSLRNKVIIIIDDVANTGRTLFYALKPFMDFLVKKIQVAVLVDRKHKSFPLSIDYVGISLATTLMDNIIVGLAEEQPYTVVLG